MQDHVYKMIELAGSSETSIEDAIQNAITRAAKTLHDLRWFEVVETRGQIENGRVVHYQVVIKVGFTIEEPPFPPQHLRVPLAHLAVLKQSRAAASWHRGLRPSVASAGPLTGSGVIAYAVRLRP